MPKLIRLTPTRCVVADKVVSCRLLSSIERHDSKPYIRIRSDNWCYEQMYDTDSEAQAVFDEIVRTLEG